MHAGGCRQNLPTVSVPVRTEGTYMHTKREIEITQGICTLSEYLLNVCIVGSYT